MNIITSFYELIFTREIRDIWVNINRLNEFYSK